MEQPLPGAGRLAIITGAAGGQGRAVARALGERGYALGLVDMDEAGLGELVDELRADRIAANAARADISDREAIRTAFATFQSKHGAPFVLAATAAILRGGLLMDLDDAAFEKVLKVNTIGAYVTNSEAARLMIAAGKGGRIVNWSSVSALHGSIGYGAYCASKSALQSLSKSLALTLAPHGITVNTILPGSIRTPMLGYFDGDASRGVAAGIPLGRWGEPEDIAAAALYLTADEAGWITGTEVVVDGGLLAADGPEDEAATRERLAREQAYHSRGEKQMPEAG